MAAALSGRTASAGPCRACRLHKQAPVFQQRAVSRRAQLQLVRVASAEVEKKTKEVEEEEFDLSGPDFAPSTQQVQDFLNTLCEDTEIAEMELKMGTFALKVRRNVNGLAATPAFAAAAAAPAAVAAVDPAPVAYATMEEAADESIDEALVYVPSPKVGILRRGKYAANKRVGKGNTVEKGDKVKKGQTLAYVEQLGTFVAVQAPQAGEVVTFKVDEGGPVEYGQVVIELAPFFGGHIIGDSKYA